MRSGIECNLCTRCPRDRIRGCCTISPVFLLTDIGYFLNNDGDEFVYSLLSSPYVDVLADQLRVNAMKESPEHQACRFHHPEVGCRIPLAYRNMVCRQFLCPNVKLWQDPRVRRWVFFWQQLQEEEIGCQQLLVAECAKQELSLLDRTQECLQLIKEKYQELRPADTLPVGYPEMEIVILKEQRHGLAVAKK